MSIEDKGVESIFKVLSEVEKDYPEMTLQELSVLLIILQKPSILVSDILKGSRLNKSTLSRITRKLGSGPFTNDYTKQIENGLNLISVVPNPFNARQNIAGPTRLGRAFGDKLNKIIGDYYGEAERQTMAS